MIYVGRCGFLATGRIESAATPGRTNWPNRYGVDCQLDQGHEASHFTCDDPKTNPKAPLGKLSVAS